MKLLFVLVKADIDFSKEEILSLYRPEEYELYDNLLILETNKDFSDRLALTKKIYRILDDSPDWNNIIKGSFKVRCKTNRDLERNLAKEIFTSIEEPKVNLKNPETLIEIFETKEKTYTCKLETIIPTDWKERKPHLKPQLSPTSLNPRIARAMINLSGLPSGTICDPFCGTGGILVEAGLLKHSTIGFDIDNTCLKKATINLDHYDIEGFKLINQDALSNNEKFDAVVTDLPYGLNTKVNQELRNLYKDFFKRYSRLCSNMVVGLPAYIQIEDLIDDWKIEKEFTVYLHKSLSKRILKLSKTRL